MRVIVVGLGNQGKKRQAVAGDDVVATVDPVNPRADYVSVLDVPLDSFDAALVCTPDAPKAETLEYLLSRGKHSLVEKPLLGPGRGTLERLAELARQRGVACYTAYNHRFEPNIVRLKEVLDSGVLGRVYWTRFFYGNGTAANVKGTWRDQGLGVLADLGSHLLDLVLFLLGPPVASFQVWGLYRHENRAYDHVVFGSSGDVAIEAEASLVSWKNTFAIDVIGETGSAHVNGLVKWGTSTLTVRKRVFPSGVPLEQVTVSDGTDPTWEAEYQYFKTLCVNGGNTIEKDAWIASTLETMAGSTTEPAEGRKRQLV